MRTFHRLRSGNCGLRLLSLILTAVLCLGADPSTARGADRALDATPAVGSACGLGEVSEVDFGILDVEIDVAGDNLELLIHLVDVLPYEDARWTFPIRILFNGELYELDHGVSAQVVTGPGICTKPEDDECEQPTTPCAETTYTYKSEDPELTIPWYCRFDEGDPESPADDSCDCRHPGFRPASLPKSFSTPSGPGLFEFILDPDDTLAEMDETNNYFAIEYLGATPGSPSSWGRIKSTFR